MSKRVFIQVRDNDTESDGGARAVLAIRPTAPGEVRGLYVAGQVSLHGGLHTLPNVRGWRLLKLIEWTYGRQAVGRRHDGGQIIQTHELAVPKGDGPLQFKPGWTVEELLSALAEQ